MGNTHEILPANSCIDPSPKLSFNIYPSIHPSDTHLSFNVSPATLSIIHHIDHPSTSLHLTLALSPTEPPTQSFNPHFAFVPGCTGEDVFCNASPTSPTSPSRGDQNYQKCDSGGGVSGITFTVQEFLTGSL